MTLIELAMEAGLNPKWAASTQGGEYKSSCPNCGGNDRFFIQPNREMSRCRGYYFCRRCEIKGDALKFACDILGFSFKDARERSGYLSHIEKYSKSKNIDLKKTNELVMPPQKWTLNAATFVEWSHKKILDEPCLIEYLEKRGIPLKAILKYKIGYCPTDLFYEREKFGLDTKTSSKKIWFPKGIVIPTFNSQEQVIRIKIRRQDYNLSGDDLPKYIAISGSMNGLNIIGNTETNMMIIVESELDSYALHNSVDDFAFVVAVGSNIKNPDNITNFLAQQKKNLIVCYDNDAGGQTMLCKWKNLYSHTKGLTVPTGKDIGEYCETGGKLRELILKYI